MTEINTGGGIIVNAYRLVDQAVETGVRLGWNRAHKHVENPEPHQIQDQVIDAVMSELCEWLKFPDFYE